jgi:Dna[CI] antecedent, DciA
MFNGRMTPLKRIVATDATLAEWEARRTREQALTILVRRQLPRALATRVQVADARSGELELAVDAGAVAGILRQRSSDLLRALRGEGWEFTGIRVRVHVRTDPAPPPKRSVNQLDRASLRSLATLARTLPRGPLKAALERLLRRMP